MEVSAESLRERYERMETEELVELCRRDSLTETASRVLNDVLHERGITSEKQNEIEHELARETQEQLTTGFASLESRLGAHLIDDVVALLLIIPFIPFISISSSWQPIWLGVGAFLAYVLFSDALPHGQSLGKIALKIAVVDKKTGKPCSAIKSFLRNVFLVFLGFFDWLFIFGRNRQRLGDMVARTIVVKAKQSEVKNASLPMPKAV